MADSKESQNVVRVVLSLLKGCMASLGSLTRVMGGEREAGSQAGSGLVLDWSGLPPGAQCLSMFTVAAYIFSLNGSACSTSSSTAPSSTKSSISPSNCLRVLNFSSKLSLSCKSHLTFNSNVGSASKAVIISADCLYHPCSRCSMPTANFFPLC